MSTDDFSFEDPEKLLSIWLRQPYGEFSILCENIDKASLSFVKEAFLEGYKKGLSAKRQIEWKEQMQK